VCERDTERERERKKERERERERERVSVSVCVREREGVGLLTSVCAIIRSSFALSAEVDLKASCFSFPGTIPEMFGRRFVWVKIRSILPATEFSEVSCSQNGQGRG
jgi:hypothetical protein